MSNVERLAWLWNTTNQYIEKFLAGLDDPDRWLRLPADEMWADAGAAARLCRFVGARVSEGQIAALQAESFFKAFAEFLAPKCSDKPKVTKMRSIAST